MVTGSRKADGPTSHGVIGYMGPGQVPIGGAGRRPRFSFSYPDKQDRSAALWALRTDLARACSSGG